MAGLNIKIWVKNITVKEFIRKLSELALDKEVTIIGVAHDGNYENKIDEIEIEEVDQSYKIYVGAKKFQITQNEAIS